MVVVIGLISVIIALLAGTIYKLAMVAWSLLLVGFFAPFAFGMFWKKANRSGAIAAFVGGFAAWVIGILAYYPQTIEACAGDFECGLWDAIYISFHSGLPASVVLLVVVSLLTPDVATHPGRSRMWMARYMSPSDRLGILPLKRAGQFEARTRGGPEVTKRTAHACSAETGRTTSGCWPQAIACEPRVSVIEQGAGILIHASPDRSTVSLPSIKIERQAKLKRELTLLPLFGLIYFTVCGGSFGIEPLVGWSGPGLATAADRHSRRSSSASPTC